MEKKQYIGIVKVDFSKVNANNNPFYGKQRFEEHNEERVIMEKHDVIAEVPFESIRVELRSHDAQQMSLVVEVNKYYFTYIEGGDYFNAYFTVDSMAYELEVHVIEEKVADIYLSQWESLAQFEDGEDATRVITDTNFQVTGINGNYSCKCYIDNIPYFKVQYKSPKI